MDHSWRPPSPAPSTASQDSFRSAHSELPPDDVPHFTDAEIRALLDEANALKEEGNECFRVQKWEEAKEKYDAALRTVPKREDQRAEKLPVNGAHPVPDEDGAEEEEEDVKDKGKEKEEEAIETDLEREARLARAVLHGNNGACWVKLGDHKAAVKSCDESLLDDPTYVKALHRRATSSQAIGTWTSLTTAQEDLQKLITLLPPSSPLLPSVRTALAKIGPQLAEAQQREKDEMMGKLKDLGNTVLGKFGLSTDNFKFEPNGQGGYSMNFVR